MLATTRQQNFVFGYHQHVRNFYKGDILHLTENSLWKIEQGAVKTLTWNEQGKIVILGYWGEGDVIGLPLSTANPYEAKCLDRVSAINIPWHECHYLFAEISSCLQQKDRLLQILRIEKMYNRLLQTLILLSEKFGSRVLQGMLVNIRLTHQELADLIGATRVTVTRLLNQLEKEGIIIRPRRFYIIVKDLKAIAK